MDKQAIIGFTLIAILFMAYLFLSTPDSPPPKKETAAKVEKSTPAAEKPAAVVRDSSSLVAAPATPLQEQTVTVKTDKVTAEFTTNGGGIKRWTLAGFSTWNNTPLQLVDWKHACEVNMLFVTADGKIVDTKNLPFSFVQPPAGGTRTVEKGSSYTLDAIYLVPGRTDSASILKRYTLTPGTTSVRVEFLLRNMQAIIANNEYQITVQSPALTEQNSVEEATYAKATAWVNGEMSKLDASSNGDDLRENFAGKSEWVAVQNKYFITALIADAKNPGYGAYLEGKNSHFANGGVREFYNASLKMKFGNSALEKTAYTLYFGPVDYHILKDQHAGLQEVMDLGWAWIVRPFSEYLFIPLITFLHGFIPNYGVVILLFTLLIKLLLWPLTKSSTDSMRKMQALQPMINETREKHKDDPNRQNMEMMKLYKEYGVNPAGGCLPLVLQMPILFALFAIFKSTIDLRHQPFIWWITDLSAPDIIVHLPFSIPLFGITTISGLALLMAITMFIQQKMTIKDPRQKSMVYMMPIMFWLMFNNFPSGLNLYYFMFNLLSIIQQYYTNARFKDMPLEKVPQKKRKSSWTERAMANLQDKAKEQQKSRKR